ncbi:hypothetical protein KEM48_012682 [Puccinia striiformis f. sp. tritici PST-130]|nr:hypothetical protein KEM48_012682 [Puccinia striiformis f. sp. tritici PST-130]
MEYPIGTKSPILDTRDTKFQSDINHNQHSNLNRLLNQRIRVSKDWSGKNHNSTPRSIAKEKLAHLDIHCPGQQFDFRISVNIGHPVPLPPDHLIPDYKRINDQLSYSHQICQINWNAPVPVLDTSGTGTRIGLACTAGTCSQ